MTRKTLVVAVGPHVRLRTTQALSQLYDLVFVDTVADATTLLAAGPDHHAGIVCSVHFDESRMFDLLEVLRARRSLESVPFVAVQFDRGAAALTPSSRRSLEILGAELADLQELPGEDGDHRLRETISRAIGKVGV